MFDRIWITGAKGLIGNHLVRTAKDYPSLGRVVPLGHEDLDLTDSQAIRAEFARQRPELVIHCAALTRTQDCDRNPGHAQRLNVEATAVLADLAGEISFFFFSTDLVFDGRAGNYGESAAANPLSRYGETKAAAEQRVLANPRHTVIRTSLNAGPSLAGSRGFDEQIRNAWARGETLRLFNDEFRCPIPAEITARAIWELAIRGARGIFHVAGAERLSRHDIGRLLAARHPELTPRIVSCSAAEYLGPPRPLDTSLNCTRVASLLSFPLPRYSDWVASRG
jgi:dTDP-4-dehydrorhamnose reductase